MANLEELVRGSIDTHVHHGPDPHFIRRFDALQTAREAEEMGLRAIVLKSHDYTTAPLARVLAPLVPKLTLFGGVSLDFESGCLNPYAVEATAKMGGRLVWMPTFSSANSRRMMARLLTIELKGEGISILDAEGKLLPAVMDILDIIKEYNMVLATGHLATTETFLVVDEACRRGLTRIIISHPMAVDAMEKTPSLREQQQLAAKGAFIEHCLIALMPTTGRLDPKEMIKAMRSVGVEHCIMSTDFGQAYHPHAAEGMRMFIGTLLRCGMSDKEIELMAKVNPARVLGLD